jgi:hypothetical protein
MSTSDAKKEYMKKWRAENKDKTTAHVQKFMEKSKDVTCECGGKYRENYSEKKHNDTKKHQRFLGNDVLKPEAVKETPSINPHEVSEWLKDRHQEIVSKRDENNKTPAVDKNSSIWKKVAKYVGLEKITQEYLYNNIEKISEALYNTASSQQTAMSTLRLIMKHYFEITPEENIKMNKEIKAKEAEHIDASLGEDALPENMMTFKEARKEAKKHDAEGGDRELATYFHIHSAFMPVLRMGDWVNASTVDSGKNNFIDLEKGTFTRRISKVKKAEPFTFKLPNTVLQHLKDKKIEGNIFESGANKIHKRLVKAYPDKDVSNRGFRTLYSSTEVTQLKNPKRILHHLEIANHNISTWATYYYKGNDPMINAFKTSNLYGTIVAATYV